MGELICPNCGSKVALPEKSETVTGVTFSKESNGKYFLKMEGEKKMTREEKRIEMFKEMFGTDDVSKYYDMKRLLEDDAETTAEEDDLLKKIDNGGDVFNAKLDGRWIMAQMFHMNYKDSEEFDRDMHYKGGYMYQWEMLHDELYRLSKWERDGEDTTVKCAYFNKWLVVDMIEDYIKKVREYFDSLPTKYCGRDKESFTPGTPYKRLGNRYEYLTKKKHGDVFLHDFEKIVRKYDRYVCFAQRANGYKDLYRCVDELMQVMIKLPYRTKFCKEFVDSYKGNGAYYTCNNLIRFHGCRVGNKSREESIAELNKRVARGEGWRVFGFMKELIETNHFGF